ncbi:MAG: DNA topoisomerase III [Betaproteobacteria bacterium]|nr:DNA topoisomerase III [Betaproteobacteria bacterium]MBU6513896.1 DNA topoisomerase III [Betaproteobacteria bacterium]MDE2153996.1 DNA topoisomerase III [Betaproteobacteria bacterium]MDE2477291.1 DNA topoisomerase III [Betaproteobacteria bacterium]
MSKTLVIAEKPSVAQDIVRALTPVAGKFDKHDEYFENEGYVVTSAVGHLVEIGAPEAFEVKRGKWSFAHLPVVPPHFDLKPIEKTRSRLSAIVKLLKRKDVTAVVNACDAGREGELIFRLIQQYASARQPVRRLWLQSMTPQAIRDGFEHLRSDADMLPLADAARCRSEADWLVGINGTRAMTAFNSRDGGFFLTPVGRVQTPTLSVVVAREEQIRRHVARPYFEVQAHFAAAAGAYVGKWFDPEFKKDADADRRADRIWDRAQAQALVDACSGASAEVHDESKPTTQMSPALFDLTTLQREANSRFGFSAKMTLALAQSLYERHKALTYPRTDSRHLPEDYVGVARDTLGAMSDAGGPLSGFARRALDQGYVKPSKRVFDNSKVSDHFAIIPTNQQPGALSEAEAKLYDMVARRFLSVFYPAAEFLVTTRISRIGEQRFRTEGRILVVPGWLEIHGRAQQGDEADLPAVAAGEKVLAESVDLLELKTRPPARYTEATLLSAMENAGKMVDDEDYAEAMAGKGLGTPATRSSIIEGLLAEQYMIREGRELVPTAKSFQLMTLLRGLGVEELTKPELTGEWEHKLAQMERGQMPRDAFMHEIAQMTETIVRRAKEFNRDSVPGDYATLGTPCPNCGGVVRENYHRFACTQCDFSIGKHPGGRSFELSEVEQLLEHKHLGPLSGFRSKMGRPFSAELRLGREGGSGQYKLEFDFGQAAPGESSEAPDFSAQEPLGACPKCGGRVFEAGSSYVCEHSVGAQPSCDFRTGKMILQQAIDTAQLRKLLVDGRTDLLDGFVSARTRRKFKAFLVRQPDGKVGFEFAPRPGGPAAKGGAARKSAAAKAPAAKSAATKSTATKSAAAKAPAAKKAPAARKTRG